MLKVIPKAEAASSRPPLAIVLAIDTSGSMQEFVDQGEAERQIHAKGLQGTHRRLDGSDSFGVNLSLPSKLDYAVDAAKALVGNTEFRANDQIAILGFDDTADMICGMTSALDRSRLTQAIENLRKRSGGTRMGAGIRLALEQFASIPSSHAKRMLLLTDGMAQDEDECERAAGAMSEQNTPIIGVSIGGEENHHVLVRIADLTRGRPYHYRELNAINEVFASEIGLAAREVVTDLALGVSAVKGVKLDEISQVWPNVIPSSTGGQPYRLGNIAAGDHTVFILSFTIEGMARPNSKARLIQLGLSGHMPGLGRREEIPPIDIFVEFTDDEASVSHVDPEVMGYVQQGTVSEMVKRAETQLLSDPNAARRTLQMAAGMTQHLGNSAMTLMLTGAIEELDKTGTVSLETRKTVMMGAKTKTVKTGSVGRVPGGLTEEEIRRLTDT